MTRPSIKAARALVLAGMLCAASPALGEHEHHEHGHGHSHHHDVHYRGHHHDWHAYDYNYGYERYYYPDYGPRVYVTLTF